MSETLSECFGRVQLMSEGDPTWDLSDNDQYALKSILVEIIRLMETAHVATERATKAEAERDAIQETLTAVEHEVALVYCHITGNRISKCNTLARDVIAVADDIAEAERLKALEKDRERLDWLEANPERCLRAWRSITSGVYSWSATSSLPAGGELNSTPREAIDAAIAQAGTEAGRA